MMELHRKMQSTKVFYVVANETAKNSSIRPYQGFMFVAS
jgi:hypothetical protein